VRRLAISSPTATLARLGSNGPGTTADAGGCTRHSARRVKPATVGPPHRHGTMEPRQDGIARPALYQLV